MRNGQHLLLITSIQEALLSTLKLCKTTTVSLSMALFITVEQVVICGVVFASCWHYFKSYLYVTFDFVCFFSRSSS